MLFVGIILTHPPGCQAWQGQSTNRNHGPIHPHVAAVSVPPSTKNFVAQAAMQEPWAVLHAKAAAGKAAPPVAAPNVRPAAE